ncbi:MAG: 2Fe-2S iron-sulfur cluster binding domain-containing protein [Campylobacterales bacterium]
MTTRVEIMNDFLAINVKPGKTIQDIVEASGSALPFGCRDGECGTPDEDCPAQRPGPSQILTTVTPGKPVPRYFLSFKLSWNCTFLSVGIKFAHFCIKIRQ